MEWKEKGRDRGKVGGVKIKMDGADRGMEEGRREKKNPVSRSQKVSFVSFIASDFDIYCEYFVWDIWPDSGEQSLKSASP